MARRKRFPERVAVYLPTSLHTRLLAMAERQRRETGEFARLIIEEAFAELDASDAVTVAAAEGDRGEANYQNRTGDLRFTKPPLLTRVTASTRSAA